MEDFFIDKFEYNRDSNRKIYALFANEPRFYTEVVKKLFNHNINAHHVWNKRILGSHATLGIWQVSEVENLDFYDTENLKESLHIIKKFTLKEKINYHNSSGKAFTNTIEDILFHILNHSTYHRAQIITELKRAGAIPVATDYIFYKR